MKWLDRFFFRISSWVSPRRHILQMFGRDLLRLRPGHLLLLHEVLSDEPLEDLVVGLRGSSTIYAVGTDLSDLSDFLSGRRVNWEPTAHAAHYFLPLVPGLRSRFLSLCHSRRNDTS